MLAAQLFGTGGVAILLILAQAMQMPSLVDVALIYALLAAVTMVVFVRRQWGRHESTEETRDESH
jgi:multicomponent Na+:H+ antiporter subunit F